MHLHPLPLLLLLLGVHATIAAAEPPPIARVLEPAWAPSSVKPKPTPQARLVLEELGAYFKSLDRERKADFTIWRKAIERISQDEVAMRSIEKVIEDYERRGSEKSLTKATIRRDLARVDLSDKQLADIMSAVRLGIGPQSAPWPICVIIGGPCD